MNKTAIELTGQTLAQLYNINLKVAGLCWSDNPNYCYKYNTLCQPCSSLWLNIVLLFKFGWLNLLKDPTFNQTGSLFKALQFVFYLELTTFNRYRVKFRFKLCSPYLFCLFKYIYLNSECSVKCTNYQNTVFSLHFCFVIVKIARGKKLSVSLLANTFMGRQIFWINPENTLQRG